MNNESKPSQKPELAAYIDLAELLEIGQTVISFADGGKVRDARRLNGGIYYSSGERAGQLIAIDPHPEDIIPKEQS